MMVMAIKAMNNTMTIIITVQLHNRAQAQINENMKMVRRLAIRMTSTMMMRKSQKTVKVVPVRKVCQKRRDERNFPIRTQSLWMAYKACNL